MHGYIPSRTRKEYEKHVKEFEKRLKKINSNLCIITDCQSRPVEILFADDDRNVVKTVFDLIKYIWHEGYYYLDSYEISELRNLLKDSCAFLDGEYLFKESDLKDLTPDNPFKDYTDHLAEVLQSKNDAYGDSFSQSVDDYGLKVIGIRLSDKYNRIKHLVNNGKLKENDESLADTLLDMASYSILALKYLKEHGKTDIKVMYGNNNPIEH